ncbi:MAG: hypothetical protein LAN70_13625 [Acidobacteriia bacterium]|nr:hypothetical protein [Terriglobia bacterium]
MQLLNVLSARSTWLFDINDLNPRGKSVMDELIDWLKDSYNFEKAPSSPTDFDDTKGLAFKRGRFQAREEIFVDVELTIYTDGIVANTWSSTRDTDAFIEDVLKSAAAEFGLTFKPDMVRLKSHLSEITIRLDQPLSSLNARLSEFAAKLTKSADPQGAPPFEVGGLSFWADASNLAFKIAPFTLERKVGAPFGENRYYAKAPLHTDDHIRLIGELEEILKKPN